jgi:GPH family glycoside/pentoside/hexuronide:cation symporter
MMLGPAPNKLCGKANMTTQAMAIEEHGRVPLLQKVAFGIGMLGNQMFPAALGIFMVVLVQGLGMDPLLWGTLFFLPRLFDALTDPVMGFITDNTKSCWGRRRPYLFVGAIIAGLAYIFMWQLNPENSQMYNFTYFLLLAFVFYLGLTVFATPYVAMGYEMSSDFHERTRLMAVAQWIGQWAWVIVPWFWVILYNPDIYPNAVEGARNLAIWVGLSCLVMAMVPALFCRTQPVDPDSLADLSLANLKQNTTSLARGFGETFKCRPFMRICLATFLVFNAFNTIAGFSWFIIVYYMYNGDTTAAGRWPTWFGTNSALATCFLVIPAVTLISQKLGKKNAFLISQGISVVGYIAFWWCFKPGSPLLMFLPLPLFAFGIGGLFTIMMSMTADICDLDELNTGSRREGVFGAVYWWMVKVGFAVAGLGSGLIMKLVGFDQSVAVQTPEALTGMRLAYILIPITGTLFAMAVMWPYDITEERSREIRGQIAARKKLRAPTPANDAPEANAAPT